MLDDSAPVKPSKEKTKSIPEEEKNNSEEKNKIILAVSFPMNFSYKGNTKKIPKLEISKNINFSYNKREMINKDKIMPTPNSSIDFKSSMLQSKKDITNLNINNSTTINKNVISEDNVNIRMTETLISKQTTNNINNDNENKNDEIMQANNLINLKNNINTNINNNEINLNKKEKENIQAFTFKDKENIILTNKKEEEKQIINDFEKENNMAFKKIMINNNYKIPSSLIIQNNNYSNRITDNKQKRSAMTEVYNEEEKNNLNNTYNKMTKKIKKVKDNNYVKAVISINIPGEEKKNSNIIQQFNSLVDRLNGQKSQTKAREIIKRSERYYELYKNPIYNYIINKILNPKKIKRNIPHGYFKDISSFLTNSEASTVSSGKGNSLNSRILALKERTNPNN